MTSRMGIFAFIYKRTLIVKYVKSKMKDFRASIHTSLIRFDDSIKIKMPLLSPTMTVNDVSSRVESFRVKRPTLKENICISFKHNENDIPKLLGPSVRKLLQEYNIHFSEISSSGPQNNILKGDIIKYITKSNVKRQLPSIEKKIVNKRLSVSTAFDYSFIDLPISSMRKTIAQRLSESKSTIPHAYISIDCSVGNIVKLQKHLKKDGVNASINDFVIKSVAHAISENDKFSVVYANGSAIKVQKIDISIAISTENGLITPTIKNVNCLTVQEISDTVRSLALKAREGKFHIDELQGGSFTISNLGMFGISEFSAVINPPQGAVLAIGTTRLVADKNKPIQKMNITLSYDCRLIEELVAGEFLRILKIFLENPSNILF